MVGALAWGRPYHDRIGLSKFSREEWFYGAR